MFYDIFKIKLDPIGKFLVFIFFRVGSATNTFFFFIVLDKAEFTARANVALIKSTLYEKQIALHLHG